MMPLLLAGTAATLLFHPRSPLKAWLDRRHMPKELPSAAAQVHGQLMAYEIRPQALRHAAMAFGAAQLVERSRMGDQNAMGMISAVADQANRGNPRAQTAAQLIHLYCQANPPPSLGPLGEPPQLSA